jgi:hypothetical protein
VFTLSQIQANDGVTAPRAPSSAPPDDIAHSVDAVMLTKIGAPSASAPTELFRRFRPPGTEAAGAGAAGLIVDKD